MAEKSNFTNQILQRTKQFTLDNIQLCQQLPETAISRPLLNQLVRASASVGANFRATRRAKSKPDFINKFKIVEEELDESLFFLEILVVLYPEKKDEIERIEVEGNELLKIVVATINSLKK